jgi:uncharacterized protein YdhG (YjbR/CyaY superfamily)
VTRRPELPSTVDDYLAAVPHGDRAALRELRTVIRSAAPDATEEIRFKMPTYHQQGLLVGFAAFKGHLGF